MDAAMTNSLKTLTEIQDQIAKCRRMAIEVSDPETSRVLSKLADDLEGYLRRVVTDERNLDS
jgi:hypothetical protein